jgi:hypothetical protein
VPSTMVWVYEIVHEAGLIFEWMRVWGLCGLCVEVLGEGLECAASLPLCRGPPWPTMALPHCTPPDLDMSFHMVASVAASCYWLGSYSQKTPWSVGGEGPDTTEIFQKKYPHDPHIF